MKFSCTQENFSKGLALVNNIISTRATLPILNNILFQTDKGRLKLSSTDLEIGINTWIGAKIEKEGSITLPARLVSEFISSINDPKIEVVVDKTQAKLSSRRYKASIMGTEASEFPLIPKLSEKPLISLDPKTLQKAIKEVSVACAVDESRPVLSGILIRFLKNQIKMVATDSYRLAEKTIKKTTNHTKEQSLIVPVRTLSHLARILGSDSYNQVDLVIAENQILFILDDKVEIVSRLIEGNFPDYEQVIPKSFQTKAIIDKEEFANAIKIGSFFARESANNIKLQIKKENSVKIYATAAQVGDNQSELAAEVTGETNEVAFNAKFILDALSSISTNKIIFEMTGKLNPGVIKPEDGDGFVYVIMPIRIEE